MKSAAQRAVENLEKGNHAAAIAWARSLPGDARDADDVWNAARILAQAGILDEALERFQVLHRRDVDNPEIAAALACCLAELGQFQAAQSLIASRLGNASCQQKLLFALAFDAGGDQTTCINILESNQESAPPHAESAVELSRIHLAAGDPATALRLLRAAIEAGIADASLAARAWFNLGVLLEQSTPSEAEDAYRRAIDADAGYSKAWINLAVLMIHAGRHAEAIELLLAAQQQFAALPDHETTLTNAAYFLAFAYRLGGNLDAAIDQLKRLVDVSAEHAEAWELLGRCLVDAKQTEAAIRHFRRWLSVSPGQPVATHLLAAIDGDCVPDRASSAFVAGAFDNFASTFDATLSKLEYRGPEYFASILNENLPTQGRGELQVLDAGCGTGLLGPVLRSYAERLIGVDLSQKMLQLATARGSYDELICADLLDHLAASAGRYDLIVAADTLIYFGDLSKLIPLCFAALKPDGWLAFSVEQGPLSEENFYLLPHGRYVHSPNYIILQLGECGITGGTMRRVVLRKENERDVHALLVVAQLPKA